MAKISLTNLEKDVLVNGIYKSNFNDINVDNVEDYGSRYETITTWSDCVIDSCKETKINQVSGVMSSLVKKGLVTCTEGKDAVVTVTNKGFEVLKSLVKK